MSRFLPTILALIALIGIGIALHRENASSGDKVYTLASCPGGGGLTVILGKACEAPSRCTLDEPCAAASGESDCDYGYYPIEGQFGNCTGQGQNSGSYCSESANYQCRQDYTCQYIQFAGCQATTTSSDLACAPFCYSY